MATHSDSSVPRARALSIPSTKRPRLLPALAVPQGVYVGIEIHPVFPTPAFSIYVHDGFYEVDFTTQIMADTQGFHEISDTDQPTPPVDSTSDVGRVAMADIADFVSKDYLTRMETAILAWLKAYAASHRYKIMAAGIGAPKGHNIQEAAGKSFLLWTHVASRLLRLHAKLWFELDVLPVFVNTRGVSLDERACSAARKAQIYLNPHFSGNIPRIVVGYRHMVEIDGDGSIRLADAVDYQRTVTAHTWTVFKDLVGKTEKRRVKIAFFSSTSQGGGVALMRHALLRLFGLTDLDVKWFVMKPNPAIFEITKRKFHNVLQGVAPSGTELTDKDKALFVHWCNENVKRYWADGPLKESDVIVIDDPQPCGIIPAIKRLNPRCKIIYRSHIEIASHLADDPKTEQHHVWQYLWGFIQHADLFISHPVASFVPKIVPRTKLLMMPACTDMLDGLNKELDPEALTYYQSLFNRIATDAVGRGAEFGERPYIVQIARFDPSKGIPDVLRAYRALRLRLEAENVPIALTPQLILAGHGSIDDPDGNLVFEQVLGTLANTEFENIVDDIVPACLPPSDQMLNCLLRGALVALQLSTREGFEVKVTEALQKGVPVVAYAAGGIPHQIIDEKTGFLVPVGNVEQVVERLHALVTNPKLRERLSRAARQNVNEDYFTVVSAINWMFLFNHVLDNKPVPALEPETASNADEAVAAFERGRRSLSGNVLWVKVRVQALLSLRE
ncbi:uncharacterized protein EV422DRAFT_573927 [Fimicolochytrium jonesii]|uniref:uncharacterized protein n=1 Tax=Fimicolochytrium jonesii TaxID=1396493 RepID=UPI0022FF32E7|nr:uncharacterized protein EV422DRAFT_573927 [Fimicolochytrium jonesii]KAI8820358.1 hypothetical protein EV422DRAFT_573927 [Fimicolochytrium jonesii]